MARYYPHGNNHKPSSSIAPGNDKPMTLDDNGFVRWIYGKLDAGTWTEEDQSRFERYYGTPGIRNYIDYIMDRRDRERLFTLLGIDYSDIGDPRNVKGSKSAAALHGQVLNFVSDNIKRLYK